MIYIRTQSMQVKVQSLKNDVVWERVNLKAWNEECSLYIRIPQKREKREGLMKSSLMQMKRSDTAKLCAVFNLDMEDPNVRLDDRAELVEYCRGSVRIRHAAGPSGYSTFAGRSGDAVAREAAYC